MLDCVLLNTLSKIILYFSQIKSKNDDLHDVSVFCFCICMKSSDGAGLTVVSGSTVLSVRVAEVA